NTIGDSLSNQHDIKGAFHPNNEGHRTMADWYNDLYIAGFPETYTPPLFAPSLTDGTVVSQGVDTFVTAGGSPFRLDGPAELTSSGYRGVAPTPVTSPQLDALSGQVADGTRLRDAGTA